MRSFDAMKFVMVGAKRRVEADYDWATKEVFLCLAWGVILSAKIRLSFKFDFGAVNWWIVLSLTRWTVSLTFLYVV